ncbi:unnamed protein product [Clavelina lepadiformis]|uniref:Protein HGH1 homolog n=1 Tax=Clavelina lepadiformis TaxID=159417 RepID=A0ABP0FKC5_CLALP
MAKCVCALISSTLQVNIPGRQGKIMEEVCKELVQFMQLSSRLEIKLTATKNVLALSGAPEGRKFILENKNLLEAILTLTKDKIPLVVKDCYLSLVNLSAEDYFAKSVLEKYNVVPEFLKIISDPNSEFSHQVCMIMSNLTRSNFGSTKVVEIIFNDKSSRLNQLLDAFYKTKYNKHGASLNHLASLFTNLTQIPKARSFFLDETKNHIQRLLPYLQYQESLTRRGGIASMLRNCCFEYESHGWLLGEKVDILPHLLLPLAGPEEFSEADTDKLPLDLQYLPSDKTREPDEDIRKILIQSIILLCADESGREFVKSKNAYVIIRELHQWELKEQNSEVAEECEKLIQVRKKLLWTRVFTIRQNNFM